MAKPTTEEPSIAKDIIERYLLAFYQICNEERKEAYFIANSLNLSAGTISQFKSGRLKTIRADYIVNICTQYGYSIIWMMTGEGEMKADEETLSIQQDINLIKKNVAKILELQKDALGPLINEILGIKIDNGNVTSKLIGEVKRHTKLNS